MHDRERQPVNYKNRLSRCSQPRRPELVIVTAQVAVNSPSAVSAMMVALTVPVAVIKPLALTVATFSLVETQSTFYSVISAAARCGQNFQERAFVRPITSVIKL